MSVRTGGILRVAINAQMLQAGTWGGIEQFILGLVRGLGKLGDGSEEYLIVVHRDNKDWLDPYLGPNQRIVFGSPSRFGAAKKLLGPFRRPAGNLLLNVRRLVGIVSVPESNGFYESLSVDVVHFPYQVFIKCAIPMVYNPHDLQHLHYPQFFTPYELTVRKVFYPAGCHAAQAIATDSHWVKQDLVRQYGVTPQKIHTILFGPTTELYGNVTTKLVDDVAKKFHLPQVFSLYPAQTWQHKNHLRLLEAMALLRDRDGITLHLVCTGKQNEFYRTIAKRIRALRLEAQVRFLGFVEPRDLRALYHLAQFVIHPSLFEGGGLPILEAFREGTPVACSRVTSLPEYAGDAALYFDPENAESIAGAAKRMMRDADLRARLRERGAARTRLFTWERTAKAYRALYRKVAGRALSDEESQLLASIPSVA